ncbi:hypothetical protein AB0H42_27800 [Nocardia sp. NPDC050799]
MNRALHGKGFRAPGYSNPPAGSAEPDPRDPKNYFAPDAPLPTENGC